MRTFTSAEARAALGVDAKTFLRWLKKANMEPTVSRRDNRIKLFTQQQLEQLAQEHERTIDFEARQQAETLPSAEERIEALEERVSELERKLDELSAGTKPYEVKTPPVRIVREPIRAEGAVAGLVKAMDFAELHRVKPETARKQFQRQTIETTKPEGIQQSHYLTPSQQHKAIDYWEAHKTPGFERCPQCPHE